MAATHESTQTHIATAPKGGGYSQAEQERISRWQDSTRRKRDLYWKRHAVPWKNLGPSAWGHAWGDLPMRTTWHVVHDLPLAGGTVLAGGAVVPQVGAMLRGVPLAAVCCSRGQGVKALRRTRAKVAGAYLVRYVRVMSPDRSIEPDARVSVLSLEANPGAPAGWWNVRASSACVTQGGAR